MKAIFWSAAGLLLLLFLSARCGPSPSVKQPQKNPIPSAPIQKPPESVPSAIPATPVPFPMEAPRPVPVAPVRTTEQVLPGQVFPPPRSFEIPLSNNNGLSEVEAFHLDGPPPVVRRRR